MKININRLALIKNSKFEDEQFTVIMGDNGTGKTILLETLTHIKITLGKLISDKITKVRNSEGLVTNIEWNKEVLSDMKSKNEFIYKNTLKYQVDKLKLEQFLNQVVEEFNESLNRTILNNILDKGSDLSIVDLSISKINIDDNPIINFTLQKLDNSKVRVRINSNNSNRVETGTLSLVKDIQYGQMDQNISENITFEPLYYSDNELNTSLENYFMKYILKALINDVVYKDVAFFPTERTTFYDKRLFNSSINNPDEVDIRFSERLFYEAQENFKEIISKFKIPSVLNSEIITKLSQGTFEYDEGGEVSSITQNNGVTVPRKLFSTKLNRIIPYSMLENPMKNYELVIIEEPEAHLSIESMRSIIDLFEYILKTKKMKLIISTHSEILFRLLNNTILRDESIKSNVFEMSAIDGSFNKLVSSNKTAFGYKADLMTNGLNRLFKETTELDEEILKQQLLQED